jgi:hypothetical protein
VQYLKKIRFHPHSGSDENQDSLYWRKKTKREEKDEKLKKKIILPLAGFYDVVI